MRILSFMLALVFVGACASLDSSARSGASLASDKLGQTETATASAKPIDAEKEAKDVEKAASDVAN